MVLENQDLRLCLVYHQGCHRFIDDALDAPHLQFTPFFNRNIAHTRGFSLDAHEQELIYNDRWIWRLIRKVKANDEI